MSEQVVNNEEMKDIFSYLIEKELSSKNPHPVIEKYGKKFLKDLACVGHQIESIFLTSDCEDIKHPVVLIADQSYYLKAEQGIRVLEIARSELLNKKSAKMVKQD